MPELAYVLIQNRIYGLVYEISRNIINKNSVTDIGIQPEGRESKTGSHWLLSRPQAEMMILTTGISE